MGDARRPSTSRQMVLAQLTGQALQARQVGGVGGAGGGGAGGEEEGGARKGRAERGRAEQGRSRRLCVWSRRESGTVGTSNELSCNSLVRCCFFSSHKPIQL